MSGHDRFSLLGLRQLHDTLVSNKHSVNDSNCGDVVEALRSIAEMVVYGDNKSEMLFDFFCEKNMLSLFLEIMWVEGGCPAKVHIQILQTLSILVNCVRNDTSLYYLLSNNYVNEIIVHPHDFASDESLCDQYVSFMKSLSLRLDKQTIQFFFQEDTGSFPLLNRAIELLDYSEPMVRIAAQSTILNIYSVNETRARQYALQDEVMHRLFSQLVGFLETKFQNILFLCGEHAELFRAIDAGISKKSSSSSSRNNSGSSSSSSSSSSTGGGRASSNSAENHLPSEDGSPASFREARKLEQQLKNHITALEDWLFYVQDIFGLQIMRLRRALVHHLLTEWVYPSLLGGLLRKHWASKLYGEIQSRHGGLLPLFPSNERSKASHDSDAGTGADVNNDESASPEPESVALPLGLSGRRRSGLQTSSKWSPSLPSSPEEDDHEDDAIVNLVVSLQLLVQMLTVVHDPMLHRAIATALLHPLSRKGRKAALDFAWVARQSGAASVSSGVEELLEQEPNPYRAVFCELLSCGNQRLSLLANGLSAALIHRRMGPADSLPNKSAAEAGSDRLKHCWVMRAMGVWPLAANSPPIDMTKMPPAVPAPTGATDASMLVSNPPTPPEPGPGPGQVQVQVHETSKVDEGEKVEQNGEPTIANDEQQFKPDTIIIEPEGREPSRPVGRPRLRTESMERERAAAKGLSSGPAHEPDDLDCEPADEDEAAWIVEPDVINMSKVGAITALLHSCKDCSAGRGWGTEGGDSSDKDKAKGKDKGKAKGKGKDKGKDKDKDKVDQIADCGLGRPIVLSILDELQRAHTNLSLVNAQVLCCTLYSLVGHFASAAVAAASGTESSLGSQFHLRANTDVELAAIEAGVARALQECSQAILARIGPAGAGGPTQTHSVAIVLHEELRRLQGCRWDTARVQVFSNSLLYLPCTNSLIAQLGLDHDVPICQAEMVRREAQVYLLLRALRDGVAAQRAWSASRCAKVRAQIQIQAQAETSSLSIESPSADLLALLQLPALGGIAALTDLRTFSDQGVQEGLQIAAAISAASGFGTAHLWAQGQAFDMKGKKFLDTKIVPQSISTPDPQVQRRNRNSGSDPYVVDNPEASPSSFSMTNYFFGSYRRSSASPTPPIKHSRGRTGNAFFIQHDTLFLLVGPTQDRLAQSPGTLSMSLTGPSATAAFDEKFEVISSVPLVSIEVVPDATDKIRRTIKIVARCWEPVPNFEPVGGVDDSDIVFEAAGTAGSTSVFGGAGSERESFASAERSSSAALLQTRPGSNGTSSSLRHSVLMPRPASTLWQLTLQFEGEQACLLAREHLDSRAAGLKEKIREALERTLRKQSTQTKL